MKKIFFLVLDGLGDEEIPELENKTPLEYAFTPNLDEMARKGISGQLVPFFSGKIPTSEEGHYALFGYNPKIYGIKRGVVTAFSAGIELDEKCLSFRGNLAYADNGRVIDRRAGRIKKTKEIVSSLNEIKIPGVEVVVSSGGDHRLAVVFRGEKLSDAVSDGDSHYEKLSDEVIEIFPTDDREESVYTAELANIFLKEARKILQSHPENIKRISNGLFPANDILLRGASFFKKIPTFESQYNLKASCVAGKELYKGIACSLGMKIIEVEGADGTINTNLKGKIKTAVDVLNENDFIFVHIKATDSLAEDGDYLGKKCFIEKIDKELEELIDSDFLVVVTSDHSTCSLKKSHCSKPIPLLVYGSDGFSDSTKNFSEKECVNGLIGEIDQLNLMEKIIELAD